MNRPENPPCRATADNWLLRQRWLLFGEPRQPFDKWLVGWLDNYDRASDALTDALEDIECEGFEVDRIHMKIRALDVVEHQAAKPWRSTVTDANADII